MAEQKSKATTGVFMNPSTETIHQKHMDLQSQLNRHNKHHHKGLMEDDRKELLEECQNYLDQVSSYLNKPLFTFKWPFFSRKHPHLLWELLHRTDENFILLMEEDELYARAVDVKIAFDMNIKEEKLRNKWIGDKGIFRDVFDHLEKEQNEKKEQKTILTDRYLIKDAQKIVDETMDQNYWQLSMNTLTSALSSFFLALLLSMAVIFKPLNSLQDLGTSGGFIYTYFTLIGLGLIGAYLSNLMTNEDFLYVRGGPNLRYWVHNIFSKPVIGAFAAIFTYGLEKTKLIFSINMSSVNNTASQVISINVKDGNVGYTYAVLAIASGFAADKLLRSMFDKVLKKLEQKAEKSKDTDKK